MEGNIDFSDCDEELLIRSVNETMTKYNEFSDCDEELLFRSAEEIESAYIQSLKKPLQNRKRKLDVRGDDKESKKSKVENALFVCDICERNYKRKTTLVRHEKTHYSSFPCSKWKRSFTPQDTMKRHEKKCKVSLEKKKHSFANTVTYHFWMI